MSTKTLKLFATLRDVAGAKELSVNFEEGQTVRQLVSSIQTTLPKLGDLILNADGTLSEAVQIFVHGRNVMWLNGLDTTIRNEDIITLIPPSAGG